MPRAPAQGRAVGGPGRPPRRCTPPPSAKPEREPWMETAASGGLGARCEAPYLFIPGRRAPWSECGRGPAGP
eukprot:1821628-Prymnesium_polylepis.1